MNIIDSWYQGGFVGVSYGLSPAQRVVLGMEPAIQDSQKVAAESSTVNSMTYHNLIIF